MMSQNGSGSDLSHFLLLFMSSIAFKHHASCIIAIIYVTYLTQSKYVLLLYSIQEIVSDVMRSF